MTYTRSLRLTWKDVRGPDWTKRARVYEGRLDCRINVEDDRFSVNLYVGTFEKAEEIVDKFEAGASVKDLMEEYANDPA